MKSILVTGGAGFIGSCFVRQRVLDEGHQVVNLDKLTYAGNPDSLAAIADSPRYKFVQGDIADAALVARLLTEHQPEAIVNFAAESHVDRSIDGPREFVKTNVLGTFELLNAARAYWSQLPAERREAFRFLHVSTDEVYGSLGAEGRFVETTAYAPNSPYAASKASSDHFVRAFHHTFGFPVLTTNCSNNYGPYQFPEKLIPLMIVNALSGKPLPVYGDGRNVRDWLFVEDHCIAIQRVLEAGRVGEVYNIGGDSERNNLEVVHAICGMVDKLRPGLPHAPCQSLIKFVTDRPGHDWRYAIDAAKIRAELGWSPSMTFEQGIEQTVRWYLENPEWIERVTSGKYRQERLGLGTAASSAADAASDAEADGPCPIEGVIVRPLKKFRDSRGWLGELFRNDELPDENIPVMAYVSETLPGVARGPHEHVDQADYFAFIGPGEFMLYLWDARLHSQTHGLRWRRRMGETAPQAVIIPPGVVHAYRCVSEVPGWVFNAPNQLYAGRGRKENVDEIRHEDTPGSPYHLF